MSISPTPSYRRSPKRLRYSSGDESEEEEEEHAETNYAISSEEEEEYEQVEQVEEEEEEVAIAEVTRVTTTAASIANDYENVIRSLNSTPTSSSSSSSPQSVKLKSSDVLDCPTCCEPLKKPIYQCTNGHLACSLCVIKLLNRCPFCRSHIGDIRCIAVEKIIESSIVSCRNSILGCKETTTYGNQSNHEKLCLYIRCSCPLPDCNYTGSYADVRIHARFSHSWYEDNHVEFEIDRPFNFYLNLSTKKTAVFREERDGDLIVAQSFRALHGVYITVSLISPVSPGMRNFSCSLAKLDTDTSLRLGLMVKKVQKVVEEEEEEEEPKDGFMLIPNYMLSGGDHLEMRICIGREDKYVLI